MTDPQIYLDEENVREQIEDLLVTLARLTSPEETLSYVERMAERMREEIE